MKRFLSYGMAALMLVGLLLTVVGCGGRDASEVSKPGPTQSGAATSSTVEGTEGTVGETTPSAGIPGTESTTKGTKSVSVNTKAPTGKGPVPTNSGAAKTPVRVGYSAEVKAEYEVLFSAFKKAHPDIPVTPMMVAGNLLGLTPKLTALAAAGTMPDLIMGSGDFAYIMQQGWAYPLDNLLAADAGKGDVLQMGLDRYTYNGHLYALPSRLQFDSVVVNLDLLDELNLDQPAYDWTLSEFVEMAKKATTTTYSGVNYIYNTTHPTWGLDNKLMNAMLPNGYEQYGFSFSNHNFNLQANNAWVESVKLIQSLQSVPGLVSDELKDYALRNNGKVDDYDKKFGRNADAFVSGKVLFGNHSTWEWPFFESLKYSWDTYPVPTKDGNPQRIATHVDFAFMSSSVTQASCQNVYTFLKFISYDKEGCQARMDYSINKSAKATGARVLYIPATENKDVVKAFNALKVIPDGLKYMFNTVVNEPKKAMVADCDKVVPDYWQNVTQYRDQAEKKVADGTDPASLVNDLQTKINKAMTSSWSIFSKKVDQNLAAFYKTHPYEQK